MRGHDDEICLHFSGCIQDHFGRRALGITFSAGQIVGLIGSWIVPGLIAIAFTVILLRSLPKQVNPFHQIASHRGLTRSGAAKRRRMEHPRLIP
jgi:hypothetical protein